jgi:uncharacterized coiled-coil protein SlyX
MKTLTKIVYPTLAALAFACFALLPRVQALLPPPFPDGGYPGFNTAEGDSALQSLTTGFYNTAIGFEALSFNTRGYYNTAVGYHALLSNTTGGGNTANGVYALYYNNGSFNTANGISALAYNTTGNYNTAIGANALYNNSTGSNNVGIGANAGKNLTSGGGNVCIGVNVLGLAGESNTTRIGNVYASQASGRAVYVNSDNKLGTLSSSRRFKEDIKSIGKASEAILALQPVTFRYKTEIDGSGTKQFGVVAEEVEKVNPDLVTRDEEGKPQTVRYEAVNAMLLNEFLKEHRAVEEQECRIREQDVTITELQSNAARQEASIARQQTQIEALTAGLQKVSAQLELSKAARQTVLNNQ